MPSKPQIPLAFSALMLTLVAAPALGEPPPFTISGLKLRAMPASTPDGVELVYLAMHFEATPLQSFVASSQLEVRARCTVTSKSFEDVSLAPGLGGRDVHERGSFDVALFDDAPLPMEPIQCELSFRIVSDESKGTSSLTLCWLDGESSEGACTRCSPRNARNAEVDAEVVENLARLRTAMDQLYLQLRTLNCRSDAGGAMLGAAFVRIRVCKTLRKAPCNHAAQMACEAARLQAEAYMAALRGRCAASSTEAE